MKNKILLSISVLLVVVALCAFWYVKNQKATLAEKPLVKEKNKQEVSSNSSEEKVDVNGLIAYRNEEYGFEFKYPNSIAPISFSREASSGNPLTLVFYDSKVVSDSLMKNPPDKKPNAKVKFVIDLLIDDNKKSEISPRDFIKGRTYNELEPFFKETRAGEFEAIELIDQPEKGYILTIKLSDELFLESGSRDNLEILNQIKSTFKSIHYQSTQEMKKDISTIKQNETETENFYKNEKYNFTLQYPRDWQVDEARTLVGPGFRPSNLSMKDIQSGKFDKNKDCFFTVAFLQVSKDKKIPCKNNLGEITLGANNFTKCQMTSVQDDSTMISYMTIHPKINNVISFDYTNNSSCKIIFEKSLETLNFN